MSARTDSLNTPVPPEPLTLDSLADILVDAILPFYKGFPNDITDPQFRRTLSGDEQTNLLTTIHNIVTAIRIQRREPNE